MEYLKKKGEGLAAKTVTLMTSGYRPEIDITPELGEEDAAYFHLFNWCFEMDFGIGQS